MQNSGVDATRERMMTEVGRTGSELNWKFWVALVLYAVLALLVWFTMDAGKIPIYGRPVDLRLVPLVIIGALALRTVLARRADGVRRGLEPESSEGHRSRHV